MAARIIANAVWSHIPNGVKNYSPTFVQGAIILATIHQIATKGILAPPVFLTTKAIPIGVGCMVAAPFLSSAFRRLARAKDSSEGHGFHFVEADGVTEEEMLMKNPVQNKKPLSIEKALDIGKALWEVSWRGCLVNGLIQRGLIVIASSMTPKAAEAFFNTGLSYGAIGSMTAIAAVSTWKTHRDHDPSIGPYQNTVNLVTTFVINVFYGVLAAKGGLTSAIAAHATHKVVYRLFQGTL
jgi:hypothetical protein